jgi:hypothetical protein
MKDDYLWDKSGEPDPDIQKLEEILGSLRYQPQPLEIPEDLRISRRQRNYVPLLAIAATVVVALLAGIIWFSVRTKEAPQEQHAIAPVIPAPPKEKVNVTTGDKEDPIPARPAKKVAKNPKPRNRAYTSVAKKREREEALAAKEQVLLALRLASEKLNLAHRKVQSTPPANQLKNQHRTG